MIDIANEHFTQEAHQAEMAKRCTAKIFEVMANLKPLNPGDTYLEAYKWHLEQNGESFFDQYHLAWWYGMFYPPKRILEIGTRTGLSLCQLLSAHTAKDSIVTIDCIDPWPDDYAHPGIVSMNLKALGVHPGDRLHFHRDYSNRILPQFIAEGRQYDYILVDGDHNPEVAIEDLKLAVQLLAPGGVMIFDDISPAGCNLEETFDKWWWSQASPLKLKSFKNLAGKGTAWVIQ
jgi:hypothetical protein